QPGEDDHLVLEPPLAARHPRGVPPPRRRADLARVEYQAGLLADLPYRRLQVGLTQADPPAPEFPPALRCLIRGEDVKQQGPPGAVGEHHAHRVAFQVVVQFLHPDQTRAVSSRRLVRGASSRPAGRPGWYAPGRRPGRPRAYPPGAAAAVHGW